MTTTPEKISYTARAEATGGRAGHVTSDDGHIDTDVRPPKDMGGPGGATNPEQLFAAGYAACFQGALGAVGRKNDVDTSASQIAVQVGIGPIDGGFGLAVRIEGSIPGHDEQQTQALLDAAHQVCPYSNATRGNIPVEVVAV